MLAVALLAANATDNIRGCPAAVSRAVSLEKRAEQQYAAERYEDGANSYKQAASLYYSCKSAAKDQQSKDYAYLAYLNDLVLSVRYASDYRPTYDKVAKAADDFVLDSDDADVVEKVWALRGQLEQPPKRQLPMAKKALCLSALSSFGQVYEAWREAMNRYAKSAKDTVDAIPPNPVAPISYTGGAIYAGYELKAIHSVIDAEEPKLLTAQGAVERSGAQTVARTTSDIVQNVRTRDEMDLSWTKARYSTLLALSSGRSAAPFQAYPIDTSNAIQQKIDADWAALANQNECK